MTDMIKKQFMLTKKDLKYVYILMIISWFVGVAISFGLQRELTQEKVCIGMSLSMIAGASALIVYIIGFLSSNFELQISLGVTRKQFFMSYCAVIYSHCVMIFISYLILEKLEKLLWAIAYKNVKYVELEMVTPLLAGGLLVVPMLLAMCHMLIKRFGKFAGIPIWCAYMVMCLLPGRIEDAMKEYPQSVLGRIGVTLKSVEKQLNFSAGMWLGIAILATFLMGIITCQIMKKQEVQ